MVYGPNASGKSCFTDALEYILGGGRVAHLSHEYSGHYQQRGVRNTHTPEGQPSQVSIAFVGDRTLRADIQPDGLHTIIATPEELKTEVEQWQPNELILRQDGLVEFITQQKGERYSALVPLFGLTALETAADNMRRLAQDVRTRSMLAADRQRITTLTASAENTFESTEPAVVRQKLGARWNRYSQGEMPTELGAVVERLRVELNNRLARARPDLRLHIHLEGIYGEDLATKISEAITTRERANTLVDDLLDAKLPILQRAEDFLDAIPPHQTEIGCPACGRAVGVSDFREHVRDELGTLSDARAARDAAEEARRVFVRSLQNVQRLLRENEVSDWIEASKAGQASEAVLNADPRTLADGVGIEPLQQIQPHIKAIQERAAQKIKIAPADTTELRTDLETITCAQDMLGVHDLEVAGCRIETVLTALESSQEALREAIVRRTEAVVTEISSDVQQLWSVLHPNDQITDIQLCMPEGSDRAIDISLIFYGKEQPSPRNTLSEGKRNSLGLCIFLALLLREERQDWPVVLDDVVSSFDREHRGLMVDVLTQHFADRQVLLFTHDREWFGELRRLLPHDRWDFVRLGLWTDPQSGLRVLDANHKFEDALELATTSCEAAANRARAVMDAELAFCAERLRLPMPFRRGDRNDYREAASFVRGLISASRSRFKVKDNGSWVAFDAPYDAWQDTLGLLITWANRGSHAGEVVMGEVTRLIESCERFLSMFNCDECGCPVWQTDDERHKFVQCRCGKLRWKYD